MIKMIIPGSIVILHLQNPREKFWGVMLAISDFGMTLRGIDVYSFDDWTRSVLSETESTIGLSTIFVPMMRVEKLVLDETSGSYKSLSDQFKERVGHDVSEFIDLPDNLEDPEIMN
ncbi:MAG TPA: hypothetical protein VH815_00780 [Acidobacteriota bacterium]